MIKKEQPVGDGRVRIINREIIRGGIRIRHPSGVEAVTSLEDLKKLRENIKGFIDFQYQQLRDLDADIAKVEILNKP